MRLAGRLSAAIEILDDILSRHRPAALALADWGRSHRFAGSRDRSAIGTLVYDALRNRASTSWAMGEETPRALALGTMRWIWKFTQDEIADLCDGTQHAPTPLNNSEASALARDPAQFENEMPNWIAANIPEWLFPDFAATYGTDTLAEGKALAMRAPVDLRVNTLKADRPRVLKALAKYNAEPTPYSPMGVRIPPPSALEKHPRVETEGVHGRGWYELQDEASQIAVLLSEASPRLQVLDLCAGSGGKTLGLAAMMQNTGQIHAYDADKTRLRPIFERLKRSGARNVQVLPAGELQALDALAGRMDVVLVDAPCSGSGVWRRRPDAKWRLTRKALADRIKEQHAILDLAASLLHPNGRLLYATCSMIAAENQAQADAFLTRHTSFERLSFEGIASNVLSCALPEGAVHEDLQLTPNCNSTDGFFVSILKRHS
jgi:16S rRNA (cytosine967-C5)-methyltransferase